jgi:hypothetical protein
MGDIGDDQREIEFVPVPEEVPGKEPIPQYEPAKEPVKEPEEVPA